MITSVDPLLTDQELPPLDLPDIDDFQDIVGSANNGNAASMEQLRASFSRGPSLAAHIGSMGSRAKYTLIEVYTQGDPLQRAVIRFFSRCPLRNAEPNVIRIKVRHGFRR